jgi:polysaccharide biosynthesis/export protein
MAMIRHLRKWHRIAVIVLLPLGALSGCSSGQGRSAFGMGANSLMVAAKDLRAASGPPPGIARELEKLPAGPYIIEPGDVLLVQPASHDSPLRLHGDQVVLPDGTIQLGQYGHLGVAGKTLEIIEAEVNALFKARLPEGGVVIVRLVTRDSKVFYVLGEVNSPGAFPLRGRETVLDAIVASAGGLNTNASRRYIILSRPTGPDSCRVVLPVHYNAIVQVGNTATNYQIRAGDRVFVPTKSFWEDCFGSNKDKKACAETPCFPREASPNVSMGKPELAGASALVTPTDPPATMGIPIPPGTPPMTPLPLEELPPPSAVKPSSTSMLPPGYKPLQPPSR